MTQEIIATVPIDPATIVRVYSGKPGCGCGCRGKYWTDARNIKRIVGQMNASQGVMQTTGPDPIYSVETETRNRWAYTAD